MRINEVILESEQLDELAPIDVARGVGKVGGKAINAASGLVGGLAGAWDTAKAGFQSGKAFVGGQRVGGGSSTPSGTRAGAVKSGSTIAYPQVVDAIPKMNADELKNLKQQIDTALQQPQAAPASEPAASQGQAAAPAGEPAAAPQGQPAASTPIPNQEKLVQSIAALSPDQIAEIRKALRTVIKNQKKVAEGIGDTIKAGWNKLKGGGNFSFDDIKKAISQMSPAAASSLLKQLPAAPKAAAPKAATPAAGGAGLPGLSAPTLQPKPTGNVTTSLGGTATPGSITSGGVSRPQASDQGKAGTTAAPAAPTPNAAPAAAPKAAAATSPYGNLTASQQAFVAAREKEGLSPDQIKAAMARGGGGGGKRSKPDRPAQLNTIGGVPGFKPDSVMSQADPKSFAAGQQKKAELDAKSAERVAAAKAKRAPAQPTNEGFYSKFLGKQI